MRAAESGSGKEVLNITQQTWTTIHQVIAIACAIEPAPYSDALASHHRNRFALSRFGFGFDFGFLLFILFALFNSLFACWLPRGLVCLSESGACVYWRHGVVA